MAPSRLWWVKGRGGALHLTAGKAALQLAPGIENVKRNGWNRPKGKRSAQRATRAQATGIETEIERSEIAAQSPAAKRVAPKASKSDSRDEPSAGLSRSVPACPTGEARTALGTRIYKPSLQDFGIGKDRPQPSCADASRFAAASGPNSTEWIKSSRCKRGCGAGSGSRSVCLPRMRTCQDAGRIRRTAATATSRMGGADGRVEIH